MGSWGPAPFPGLPRRLRPQRGDPRPRLARRPPPPRRRLELPRPPRPPPPRRPQPKVVARNEDEGSSRPVDERPAEEAEGFAAGTLQPALPDGDRPAAEPPADPARPAQ